MLNMNVKGSIVELGSDDDNFVQQSNLNEQLTHVEKCASRVVTASVLAPSKID